MKAKTGMVPLILCAAHKVIVEELPPELRVPETQIILKPFDIDELLACVAKLLHNRRTTANADMGTGYVRA